MTGLTKVLLTALPLTMASYVALAGCSSENEPATTDSNGDSSSNDDTSGSSSGSGGTSSASSEASSSGGTSAASTSGGGSGDLGDPPCDLGPTAAGEEIKKGTPCTDEDPQLCWRTCGPGSVGWKTEECVAGAYVEGDCQFPVEGDYSCYAIPDAIDTEVCPDELPQSAVQCDIPECTLCNLNGEYLDSGNNLKVGFCVCNPPDEEGIRSWTCASDTAWPCPLGNGC